MTYKPLLPGIAFSGYRSFVEWQTFEFPSKVTVLAGANNCGKSNVLRYLQDVLPELAVRARRAIAPTMPLLSGLDQPVGFPGRIIPRIALPINLADVPPPSAYDESMGGPSSGDLEDYFRFAMHKLANEGFYWSVFEGDPGQPTAPPEERVKLLMSRWPSWYSRHRDVGRMMGGGVNGEEPVLSQLLTRIGGVDQLPPVSTVVSSRRVEVLSGDEAGDGAPWLSGRGIIGALAKIQNPLHERWEQSRTQWESINRFVQVVLDDSTARINIPHDANTIQIETPERVLPLTNLGSGIEQVVILAAAATVIRENLVCLEEPETNLHPVLQKKFIKYLTDETDNQYVIATHSPHLLDDSRATAYHLSIGPRGTAARRARLPHELVRICHDLGYRPSDLMQANCVIWVEGPSDRIYLRFWLGLVAPQLAEGIDYSIMFYGGKLLSHLAVDKQALEDFIDLRRLNRFSAVVIDSDKKSRGGRINPTKRRIQSEFDSTPDAPGFAWVTPCYTIENYVPRPVLQTALRSVHPGRSISGTDKWDNPLLAQSGASFDKIAIARAVEEQMTLEDLNGSLDLRRRMLDLVAFIQSANP